MKLIAWLDVPEQIVCPVGFAGESATVGLGFTTTWYSEGSPGQVAPPLAKVAVTLYFITPGFSKVLEIFSPGMVFPLFGVVNPVTFGVGFTGSKAAAVQSKVIPGKITVESRFTRVDAVPEQMVCGFGGLAGKTTPGFGLTYRRYGERPGLGQPLAVGMMAKLTEAGVVPEF